jgi:hypothetical protein
MEHDRADTSFVLPPALLAEVKAAAGEERRPVDDLVREWVERGLDARRFKRLAETEIQRGRAHGLPDDSFPLTDEYRQDLRQKIAQGAQSLRAGRTTDGEAFMVRLDAELAAVDEQKQ